MSPKFKGDSDDWLDEEESSGISRSSGKKKLKSKSVSLPDDEANAVVVEVFPNQCAVRMDVAQLEFLCTYRRASLVGKKDDETRERSPVAVGDRVLVQTLDHQSGVIEGVCERKNQLARPAPARATKHVLVSNVDLLVMVAAAQNPDFSPGLVDRFLVAAAAQKIDVILCINKIDLNQDASAWSLYRDIGILVIEVSAKREMGISELRAAIGDRRTVFCGHSGVGKTSLLNVLLNQSKKVAEISESTGKGRHTTTAAVLLRGSSFIDTPGVREFGLFGMSPEQLVQYFPEFSKLKCKAVSCLHAGETGCQATALPRYSSYRRIFESLSLGEN